METVAGWKTPERDVPLASGPAAPARDGARVDGSRPVVLLVDDLAQNLAALEACLGRDDVEFVSVTSGRAALDVLLQRDVALAIIDVRMPDMDGFELASLMRGVERTRHVPIVFVTAAPGDRFRLKGYEAGAVDYMPKPIDAPVLQAKVDVFVTLARQRQQLVQAERMREMFMGILGHDLRNPLHAILLAAQFVLRGTSEAETRDAMQRIRQAGGRMSRMIDQVLDVSRFRLAGGVALTLEPTDLRQLTDRVLAEFASDGSRVRVEASGDAVGTWDADRLQQIVSNLIGNALQHGPQDAPLSVSIDGQRDDTVELRVHNGGPPIPEELRGALFEPFRGSGARERRAQRLGLGLYISRQLALAHGGALGFESSDGAGTTFTLSLPRHANREASGA